MVRLALFWHPCVWNDDKAAARCFERLSDSKELQSKFPDYALYRHLVTENCASALISADEFERRLPCAEQAAWRNDAERFHEGGARNEIGAHWWWNGRKMLPWLQRDYIRSTFADYAPLTDHEDDLPYDVDHICPYKDWGDDRRNVKNRVDVADLEKAMYAARDAVGNGIGNLRLIESSANRSDQDADVAEKMCFLKSECGVDEEMAKWAFPADDRKLWRRVSGPKKLVDRRWNEDRLAAFQHAVESRAW